MLAPLSVSLSLTPLSLTVTIYLSPLTPSHSPPPGVSPCLLSSQSPSSTLMLCPLATAASPFGPEQTLLAAHLPAVRRGSPLTPASLCCLCQTATMPALQGSPLSFPLSHPSSSSYIPLTHSPSLPLITCQQYAEALPSQHQLLAPPCLSLSLYPPPLPCSQTLHPPSHSFYIPLP